ncbi:Pre-mRNA-processing ATP-dependent RNA helicase PRP5 [Frankliniella fusca]|uniref:Pre-mRNA-processing ATP-dependent RNA helicase PRP5 n=1 Tax=Frankliniella fusca TaxID=407009 RepID=A0AAE1I3C6_9NEOP|nr:Pre-mRNA-processing ATP-dependent RNA helicase PRP5 [Frankliniella fusca]
MHSPRLGSGPQSGSPVGFRSGSSSSSPSVSRTASPLTTHCTSSVSSGSSSGTGTISPGIRLRNTPGSTVQQGCGVPLRSPSRTLAGPPSKVNIGVVKSETVAFTATSSRTDQAGPGQLLQSGGVLRSSVLFLNPSESVQKKPHHQLGM